MGLLQVLLKRLYGPFAGSFGKAFMGLYSTRPSYSAYTYCTHTGGKKRILSNFTPSSLNYEQTT
jgi:hypothetical protein